MVEGIDVLLHQGLAQFELWTGRAAPRRRMQAMVRDFYSRSPVSTDMSPLLDSKQDETTSLERSLKDMDAQLLKVLNARLALCTHLAKTQVRATP